MHENHTLRIGQFQSLALSMLIHLIVLGFLVVGGVGKKAQIPKEKSEVRFVKLRGGGENRPGWINPSKFAPDKSRIPDDKPAAPRIQSEKENALKPDQKDIKQLKQADSIPEEESTPSKKGEINSKTGDMVQSGSEEVQEHGRGIGRKPGPKGAGTGAISETDFPGGSQYLSRLEAEVQRRFNFHGRKSGVYAEFHFSSIERKSTRPGDDEIERDSQPGFCRKKCYHPIQVSTVTANL